MANTSTREAGNSAKKRQKRWATKVRTGCITCRTRRVKCDEGKPSCERCLAVGKKCTGTGFGGGNDQQAVQGWLSARQISRAPASIAQFSSSENMADLCRMVPMLQMRSSCSQYDIKELSLTLAASQRMYWYMDEMPCRAGYEEALDSAVKCVAIALREHFSSATAALEGSELPPHSLMSYIEALKALRQSLADPVRSCRAEVLCAAQLLGVFESIVKHRKQAPAQHVFGVSHLIEHRGAALFSTRFEKGLLIAQIPAILAQSCFNYTYPFLWQHDWAKVLRESIRYDDNGTVFSPMRLDMYDNFIVSCALVADAAPYLATGIHEPVEHAQLLNRAFDVRQRLFAWYDKYTTTDWSTFIRGDNNTCDQPVGAEHMGCLSDTYVMIMNRFYIALGADDAVAVENFVQDIAHDMMEKHVPNSQRKQDANILMGVSCARAILNTADDFEPFAKEAEDAALAGYRAMAPPHVMDRFLRTFGYPPPPKRHPVSPPKWQPYTG